jgi:hypothetical protein
MSPAGTSQEGQTAVHVVGVVVWIMTLAAAALATAVLAIVSTCAPHDAVVPMAAITLGATFVPFLIAVAAHERRASVAPWVGCAIATFSLGAWATVGFATGEPSLWCSPLG